MIILNPALTFFFSSSSSSETQTEPETPQCPERGGTERRLVYSGQPDPVCLHIWSRKTCGHGVQGEGSGGASEEGAGATAETAGGGHAQTFRETTSRPVRTRNMELTIKRQNKQYRLRGKIGEGGKSGRTLSCHEF